MTRPRGDCATIRGECCGWEKQSMHNRAVIIPALTIFILGYALIVLGVRQLDVEWDRRLLAIMLLIPVGIVCSAVSLGSLVNAFIDQ
jgi:hypothetical protein